MVLGRPLLRRHPVFGGIRGKARFLPILRKMAAENPLPSFLVSGRARKGVLVFSAAQFFSPVYGTAAAIEYF